MAIGTVHGPNVALSRPMTGTSPDPGAWNTRIFTAFRQPARSRRVYGLKIAHVIDHTRYRRWADHENSAQSEHPTRVLPLSPFRRFAVPHSDREHHPHHQ